MTSSGAGGAEERYVVVSADCHAGPPVRGYRPYVEERLLDDFDDYAGRVERYDAELVAGRLAGGHAAMTIADERNRERGLWDPGVRLARLEADGIVAEVVFPQGAVPFHQYPAISEPRGRMAWEVRDELRRPGIRAYNRWLADLCAAHPGRRAGIAVVPIRDVEAAVAEARWAKDNGLAGISLPVLTDDMPHYADPVYEPLWAACEELDLSLNVHGGAGRFYGTGPVANALIVAECDWFTRRALWMLIYAGVFERHPALRLVFTEQRTHWVRPTLDDLDSLYRCRMLEIRKELPRLPSEYFATNCYVGASFFSPLEAANREEVGVDRLMWGSDYPHVEGVWPYTWESYRHTFHQMPVADRKAILGGNAIACYGFDADLLTRAAAKVGPGEEDFAAPDEPLPGGALYTWGFREVGAYD